MRELKFRYTYKRKEDGKLYQEIIPIECLEGRGDKPLALDITNPYWDIIARDEFTGSKDKNGVEIYEGDIVEFENWDNFKKEWVKGIKRHVKYTQDRFLAGTNSLTFLPNHQEVIGNIYVNAKLLTTSKE